MRLTTVILIASLMQVSAATFGQRITINQTNVSLKAVLKEIRKQSGYDFLYDGKAISSSQQVTVSVNNATIDETLSSVFKGLPFAYEVSDKNVTIKRKDDPSIFKRISARFQAIDVSGRVVDENGSGLAGATVSVKDGIKSTITNSKGEFSLFKISEDAILKISFIGYLTKEVDANTNLTEIQLDVSNSKLDEIQVVAYGVISRRLSTGNIATVKAEDIAKSSVSNPLLALQGRVPGITIEQATGLPGSGVKVRIQGQNSILNGNDPLYVIDGVPFISQLLPSLNSIQGSSGDASGIAFGNPLSFINPGDIESIDILKDADATSIYGSRAANGAILITTKKGKKGKTIVDVNLQNGWGRVARKMNLMNTPQYLEMRLEAIKNDGINLNAPSENTDSRKSGRYVDLKFWDQNRYTDWQKELIGNTAQYQTASVSISGGDSNTTFVIAGNYNKQTTVFPGSLSDQKGSTHLSLTHISNNKKLKANFSGLFLSDNNRLQSIDLTNLALTMAPNAPALYNNDGSLNWAQYTNSDGILFSTFNNPLVNQSQQYRVKTKNLNSNLLIGYEIVPGLEVKSNFGYTYLTSNEIETLPNTTFAPENRLFDWAKGSSNFGTNILDSWTVEPQLGYQRVISNGKLSAILGSTFYALNSNRNAFRATGYNSDIQLEDIKAAALISVAGNGSIVSNYRYSAIFGRISYNWLEKYIINGTFRRDGSSRFGSKNQFQNFASIAGAWIFSEENLIRNNFKFLTFGKLKISYGTTGNDQIGDYSALSLYEPVVYERPYQGTTGLKSASLPNEYIQWEETKKMQIGLDLGFLQDRILLNTTYFRNRSSNQLISYKLASTTGFESLLSNLPGTVQNSGWEFGINSLNLKNSSFSWSTNLNLTIPKNKLVSFPDLDESAFADRFIIGESINVQKLYKYAGVNPTTGIYQFVSNDGSLTSNPGNGFLNKTETYNPDPKYFGGLQNSFSYHSFQIDALFQFVKQSGKNYFFGDQPGSSKRNQPATLLERWQRPGDVKEIQRFNTTLVNSLTQYQVWARGSDKSVSDASFIRLKNVSLSWQIPTLWSQKLLLRNARLYAQAQNIITFTSYPGLDPENRSTLSLPPLKVFTFGIQIGL